MCPKLYNAIGGETVTVSAKEVSFDFDTGEGFHCTADLINWCNYFGLTITDNGDNTFTIQKN